MNAVFFSLLISLSAFAKAPDVDLRKHPDNERMAKEAAKYIVSEGKKMPKGASEIALKELKAICTNTLHKGCYFEDKGSDIMFQTLDSKGHAEGKIYDLKGWLKRLFTKK